MSPGELIAANIRAARARLCLKQADLAARMTALGWRWYRQTASEVEAGTRRVTGEEILGLAIALETTVPDLVLPAPGVTLVMIGDHAIPAGRFSADDGCVSWDGGDVKVTS